MIEIPPEVQVKSTIKPGTVYYFTEESFKSEEPHYFIVINHDPAYDEVVFMVCASSQVEKVTKRRKRIPETVIIIEESEYECFTKKSAIDCNEVITKSLNQIVRKIENSELKIKAEMDIKFVNKMRGAVLRSPIVERRIKNMLIIPIKE